MFIFDAQLSLDKLHASWYKLVIHWPIIAARIRPSKTAPSGLEYQVPSPSRLSELHRQEPQRDPTKRHLYCLDESHRTLKDYWPTVAAASEGEGGPVVGVPPEFPDQARCTGFNAAARFKEFIDGDHPVITAQCTLFADKTLVSINFAHVFGDSFSIKSVLQGWQTVLSGGEPEPLQDLGVDPFAEYGPGGSLSDAQVEDGKVVVPPPPPPGWHVYSLGDTFRFAGHMLKDIFWTRPERDLRQRYVFLPTDESARLHKQALADVAHLSDPAARKLSRSDVMYAWLMKNSHAAVKRSKTAAPLTIANVRFRPPEGFHGKMPRNEIYGAAIGVPIKPLNVGKLLEMPLGELALHVRRSVIDGTTPENVQKTLAFTIHHTLWKKPSGKLTLFAKPHEYWSGVSDWRAIRFSDVDFTAALPDSSSREKVKMIAIQTYMELDMTKRNRWGCLGDAADGSGTWFTGVIALKEWDHPDGFGRYKKVGSIQEDAESEYPFLYPV